MISDTIYSYIKAEETNFQTDEVQLGDNWFWNFRRHVQLIFHLKHGIFFTGENNWLRAFSNILEPMLNLAYWTEDIEVKDVAFFIEDANGRALSFLVEKYHDEVFVRENDLDTLFDEITESDIDYGGVLAQKTATGRPEVLPLNSIAFCDQTDIFGAPIAFKMHFAPEKLRSMSAIGWGDAKNGATTTIEDLVTLATFDKQADGTLSERKNKVPGKTIEVYIVKGSLPASYLAAGGDPDLFVNQAQVVAFYTDKDKKQVGVTLYRAKDDGKSLKFHTSKSVYGRALGRGTGESLLPDQVWTNFLEIHKMKLLEAASKVPLVTDDQNFTDKNKIVQMENLEVTRIEEGKTIKQVPTAAPANIQLYESAINGWFSHAQLMASAFDPVLGKEGSTGTTFRGQERTVAQGRGLHDRRRGQRAKFIEEIYRDWIIPYIVRELTEDTSFIATLSLEEMTWVVDQLATNYANDKIKKAMFDAVAGKRKGIPTADEQATLVQFFKQSFLKGGNKQLISILADDFKGIEIRMGINIAGKQKDLVNLSDKLLSVFQFVFANPAGFQQAMQIPALSKAFSDILEFSGISQADFASLLMPPAPGQQPQAPGPQQPSAQGYPPAALPTMNLNPQPAA